ncbi:hypothetical protein HMPREF1992_01330 [Selenomonas sp. oral taxon 892 str. F0426]|nr:hypothetical protein HMPREF1992_01330 [Selenomonas sp. oral taxon 892 str. F0426]
MQQPYSKFCSCCSLKAPLPPLTQSPSPVATVEANMPYPQASTATAGEVARAA